MSTSFAVMVSHSTKDKEIADAVCQRLEAAGFPCWIAPRDIAPGAEWTAAIIDGIAASRMMLLVFSESANASKHVAREVLYAGDNRIPMLPVRVQEVLPTGGIAYYLLGLQWLDAWQGPLRGHLETVVARVGAMLRDLDAAAGPADIRFECAACGQPMTVEAAGAGLEVDCVNCGRPVTIPDAPPRPPPPAPIPEKPAPLPAAVVEAMMNRLLPILGPITRHLVQETAAEASTPDELCRRLAESIPGQKDREKFVRECGVASGVPFAAPPISAPPPPARSESAPVSFPPETLDAMKKELAHHLGPMAGFLVEQAARQAGSPGELHELLAAKLHTPQERVAWKRWLEQRPK